MSVRFSATSIVDAPDNHIIMENVRGERIIIGPKEDWPRDGSRWLTICRIEDWIKGSFGESVLFQDTRMAGPGSDSSIYGLAIIMRNGDFFLADGIGYCHWSSDAQKWDRKTERPLRYDRLRDVIQMCSDDG